MKVTLENETGKIGANVVISSGERLRIGRNAPAELTGGEDRFMSGSHFLIECNQNRCRVADMGSRNGTLVNGNQIKEAVLRHGDLIFAGQSRFRVCIEDNPSVPQPEPVPDATAALANETLVLNDKPKHFRHFLLVETEDGKLLYFRFYDPRVLRAFLPTCNSDESSEFFGPIHDILTEESNVTNLLSFSTGEHLVPRQITLSAVQNPEG